MSTGKNKAWFGVITLFPEMLQALQVGITGRAQRQRLLTIESINPRDFAVDKHHTVDDHPYGGGPGMVLRAGPLLAAIDAAKKLAPSKPLIIYLSPQGKLFNQQAAIQLYQQHQAFILLAGRYEGIDQRVLDTAVDIEWSMGDYILTGGELPAMVMIDVMARLIPGSVGDNQSVLADSLSQGLLKHPQYTRPENLNGLKVPQILLSGNHHLIEKWQLKQSLGNTWLKRPDLLALKQLTLEEQVLLQEFKDDHES